MLTTRFFIKVYRQQVWQKSDVTVESVLTLDGQCCPLMVTVYTFSWSSYLTHGTIIKYKNTWVTDIITVVTLCLWMDSVGRNHWSELCCTGSVCWSEKPESSVWARWIQCGCSSNTEPVKKTLEIVYLSTAPVQFQSFFQMQCNSPNQPHFIKIRCWSHRTCLPNI